MRVLRVAFAKGMILTATVAMAQAGQSGPSFDCAKASGQVEMLVCKDPELAALDRRLQGVYTQALKSWPQDVATRQRAMQRGWISGRNECWKSDDVRACTRYSYLNRIVELQRESGKLAASKPTDWACAGGEGKPFQITFHQDTDPLSVELKYGDDQVIAFLEASGGQSRYSAPDVEFSERQGAGHVRWYGTELTCKPRGAAGAVSTRQPLAGTSWQLVKFQSADDTSLTADASQRYAMTFESDGRLLVEAGCNRGQGKWTSADDVSLSLGPVALTRAQCPPSPIGDRFVRDLQYVRSYVVRDGQLHLSLMADGGIYTFTPASR